MSAKALFTSLRTPTENVTSFQTSFKSRTGSNLAHAVLILVLRCAPFRKWYRLSCNRPAFKQVPPSRKCRVVVFFTMRFPQHQKASRAEEGHPNTTQAHTRSTNPTTHVHTKSTNPATQAHTKSTNPTTHVHTKSTNQHKSGGTFQADGPASASHRCCVRISCLRLTWPSSAST